MEIKEFLIKSGCFPNLIGFDIVVRAVEILKTSGRINIYSQLYDILAKEFKTTKGRVERNIRHVISKIPLNNFKEIGIYKMPTNGEFLYFFAMCK